MAQKVTMAELLAPAAKKLCTAVTGSVKRIAIEGNIGECMHAYFK